MLGKNTRKVIPAGIIKLKNEDLLKLSKQIFSHSQFKDEDAEKFRMVLENTPEITLTNLVWKISYYFHEKIIALEKIKEILKKSINKTKMKFLNKKLILVFLKVESMITQQKRNNQRLKN